jgi:hypothetical protein
MPMRDPDTHLPDCPPEEPTTCWRHGCPLDRLDQCFECEQEKNDELHRELEAMGWDE